MKSIIRNITLVLSGGFIFYEYVTNSVSYLVLYPTFAIASILAILVPTSKMIKHIYKYFASLVIWIGLMLVAAIELKLVEGINDQLKLSLNNILALTATKYHLDCH